MPAEVIIAGDLCLQDRAARMAFADLCSCHSAVKQLTETGDYSIVNLECSVTNDNSAKPIKKAGKALRNSDKVLDLVRFMGFDAVTLANNHFADYGPTTVRESLELIESRNLDHVGAGLNLDDAQRILYKTINGINVAFINACEHEFTIATSKKGGCNPINAISLYYNILEAKQKAERIIVIIHGGHEEYQLPTPRMQQMYRFFVDAGASAVINHHQHCYSGYEVYQGKPIFYGLGNFCFDNHIKRNGIWNKGYFAKLDTDRLSEFEIIPYSQCDNEPSVILCGKEAFNENIFALNAIINNDERLNNEYERLLASLEGFYKAFMAPYSGRWSRALLKRGLLPSFLSKKRKLALYDFIGCESHVDFILNLLKK